MRRTISALGACVAALALATLAPSPMVAGTATMPVPVCTTYERLIQASAWDLYRQDVRLACVVALPV